ncbi:MAG: F0F1 ATP synthase subunit epsilon [Ignavibacteriales bacterium]|nr:F0F1 ATP synthase subunit epsilon [Ignavibacteriales bacterium]
MAEKIFQLEIVTPRKVVFSGSVESFSAPGVEGGFQVLKSHAALLSSIETGEVKLRDQHGSEVRFATSGGFVEVQDNKVVLLAETAERNDEIDVARAESAQVRAQKRLAEKAPNLDRLRAEAALWRALNRLRIASKN